LLTACAPVLCADELKERRGQIAAEQAKRLHALAKKCDEIGLDDQAEFTRQWIVPRRTGRQYFFLPDRPASADQFDDGDANVAFWRKHFVNARQETARQLFELVAAARQSDSAAAFQLLHEVLREDPDHADARRILGYRVVNGKWRRPTGAIKTTVVRIRNPELRFDARRHWRVESEHFKVITNSNPAAGRRLVEDLEMLHAVWRQLFYDYWASSSWLASRWNKSSTPSRNTRDKHQVVLFRDREHYVQVLGAAQPLIAKTVGYYHEGGRNAYFYDGDDAETATQFHEVAHQLFSETGRRRDDVAARSNFWILEGVAMYFESLREFSGYATLGGFDANRLQFARYRAHSQQAPLPLAEILALGRGDLQQRDDIQRVYSKSAGMTACLMDAADGRWRKPLIKYLIAVYAGRDDEQTLAELIGRPVASLEGPYKQFLFQVSDDAVVNRPGKGELVNLALSSTGIGDRAIQSLAPERRLIWLDLTNTAVSDRSAATLAQLTNLQQLNLEGTRITDATLRAIGGLRNLEELDVSGAAVTDDGLAHLKQLASLRVLWLAGTDVTDDGLRHLRGLKQLETLQVGGSQITRAGLDELRRHLPKLK
ncbi:MAG: DUF1570 domain-containing protein, partial [Pirellulaceae bacterium]|nr:DUF1570 domain-containing protein [Pirellulaceae bacterium]